MPRLNDRAQAELHPRTALWAVAGILGVYVSSAFVVARVTGQALSAVAVWTAQAPSPVWARPFVLLFGLSGVAIAVLVPGAVCAAALAGGRLRAAALVHRGFAVNLVQATAFVSVWKAFAGVVPSRPVFIAWQCLVTAIGLLALARACPRRRPGRFDGSRPLLVGALVLLILLPGCLWGKTFLEDASGDGTEAFEFSRSLATHQLPYWDLENGYYGFHPQFMLFAYPTQLSFIAIGETEAGQRLQVYFYVLGIYLVLSELVRRRRRRLSAIDILLLVGAAVFFLVYHAHHSTYEVVSDLAELTGTDTFFAFLSASAFYALATRQRMWWGLFAVFGSMALAAGPLFAILFLLGRLIARPSLRWVSLRSHALDAVALVVPWVGYQLLVSIYSRFHPLGVTQWAPEHLFVKYAVKLDPMLAIALVATFLVVVAVVPFFGLALILRRDKMLRMLGVPVIGYFAILAVFGRTHPHYLIPLSLFPSAILLRTLPDPNVTQRARNVGYVGYAAMLVVLTLIALPSDRTPHTAYREFGSHTLMLYDSYPAVVRAAARLIAGKPELFAYFPNGKPLLPWQPPELVTGQAPAGADVTAWGISHHTWVRYSDRTPIEGRDYHQILAAGHLAPAQWQGLSRRDLPDGWVLFYRPEQSLFASRAPAR